LKEAKNRKLNLSALLEQAIKESYLIVTDSKPQESKPHIVELKPIVAESKLDLAQLRRNKPKYDIVADLEKQQPETVEE